jgi:transcriptional regulator with XRE-family HTH domain
MQIWPLSWENELTNGNEFETIRVKDFGKEVRTEKKNQTLGTYIQERRLSRGWSLDEAAARSGMHKSYWSKLEAGQYESPSPKHLKVIGKTLGVHIENLYGLAGYDIPERLPSFVPYMRAKYADLSPEDLEGLKRYFELLRNYNGIPDDQSVFPPKARADDEQPDAGAEEEKAA